MLPWEKVTWLSVCMAVQNRKVTRGLTFVQKSARLLVAFIHHASQGVMPTSHCLYVLFTYTNIHTFLGIKGHPIGDICGITASG